ncbi:hypothetical protein ACOT7R_16765 [Clostridium perfringens]|uniref:hypothetical protein n=1 Tax=Clostridium perfringens TaxID=1502 RepID=UPI002901C3FC|nr:hypothetical protein [Clostridium perfringens]MDK0981171.1 hypothetical protein [Clostridium perfringens]MDU3020434.1 hypothetical protein [Clostridium perfringens]
MLYQLFSGQFDSWAAFEMLTSILNVKLPFALFTNFAGNIKLALSGKASVGDILLLLPDFAFMIASYIPATAVIAKAYPIAKLL